MMKRYAAFGLVLGALLGLSAEAREPNADAWHRGEEGTWQPSRLTTAEEQVARRKLRIAIANRAEISEEKWPIERDVMSDPVQLVDGGRVVDSLADMQARGWMASRLDVVPWSDDYWATYRGGLAQRYADPNFPRFTNWWRMKGYVEWYPLQEVLDTRDAVQIDMLSPAEKYGLWIGDAKDTLTRQAWADGETYANQLGRVEQWMGICHGWSPASFMEKKPLKKVTVTAADGHTQLNFYPADIRGLASLMWAKTVTPTRYLGLRCNERNVRRYRNGAAVSTECKDVNAGAWHVAVVSQIAGARRSLIIDATHDYEVWNQPVVGYRYTYFHPWTGEEVATIEQGSVRLSEWTRDLYRQDRAPQAVTAVGVSMQLTYGIEIDPEQLENETARGEKTRTVEYRYDLELDAQGRIVGGEWYQYMHPDFLWVPVPDAVPATPGDLAVEGEWDWALGMQPPWRAGAQKSAETFQPMRKLVRALIDRAQ